MPEVSFGSRGESWISTSLSASFQYPICRENKIWDCVCVHVYVLICCIATHAQLALLSWRSASVDTIPDVETEQRSSNCQNNMKESLGGPGYPRLNEKLKLLEVRRLRNSFQTLSEKNSLFLYFPFFFQMHFNSAATSAEHLSHIYQCSALWWLYITPSAKVLLKTFRKIEVKKVKIR